MQVITKPCLRITAFMIAGLYLALAITFVYFSFVADDNELLKMMGEQVNGYNSKSEGTHALIQHYHLDKKAQVCCIALSFFCILIASFAIAASYSSEHCMSYLFGYSSIIIAVIFTSIAFAYSILSCKYLSRYPISPQYHSSFSNL